MTKRNTALTLSVASILALGLLSPAVALTTSKEAPAKTEMRLHCEEYIRDAESPAPNAVKFAEFQTMRAAELQGHLSVDSLSNGAGPGTGVWRRLRRRARTFGA